ARYTYKTKAASPIANRGCDPPIARPIQALIRIPIANAPKRRNRYAVKRNGTDLINGSLEISVDSTLNDILH
ncbi:MAG TPA: hypothetical protein PKD05_00600, partial [Candidatus Melainabacteria bacterium]|nr:hypothetical protein [Candidatus Melainabacteria bacterium]